MKLKSVLVVGVATIALSSAALAQQTTSDVRGVVTAESGAAIPGADVTVTNTSTGQSRTVTADDDGRFRVTDLPAGGPYSVTVREPGFLGERVDDLTLLVGDTASLTFRLDVDAGGSDEIVVVGTRQVLGTVAPGPSVTFTAADLAELPTTSRDIKDIIALDPRVYVDETFGDGVYCVGSSNRANSLTVDGYNLNDNFGLNANGYPTQRLPFPYDVAEQVSVEIAPFDVEYGGFTGCNINVVTRTGTDDFSGRLVFDFTNGDLQGDSLEGESFEPADIDEYSYGGYVSGPIVPGRLFFTFGYEKFEGGDTSDTSFAGSGFPNEVEGVTGADVARVQQVLADVYGFEAGGILPGLDVEDERFFGKLDAYISDQHRLELSAQHTLGNSISITNTNQRFGDLGLSSTWYDRSEELTVYSGRLFSDWTDALSTEVRVSYQERETGQQTLGDPDFAQIEVQTEGGGAIFAGPDVFRHANRLEQETFNAKVKADYDLGNHFLTAGYEYDTTDVFNLFVAFSEGEAQFLNVEDDDGNVLSSGIDALEAQEPTSIFYANTITNDAEDGAASFTTDRHTFYLQDQFAFSPDIEITAGVRYDLYSVDDRPGFNSAFQRRYGIRNDDTLDGKSLIQPRVAADWIVNDRLSVNAGVGLFSGGEPAVWVSNNYTGTGILIGRASSTDGDVINGFDGFDLPDELLEENSESVRNADGFVNALDPDYEIPSVLRFSLGAKYGVGFDNFLGEGWEVGADVLYGITYDPNEWVTLAQQRVGVAPDGRPIYRAADLLDSDCPNAVMSAVSDDDDDCEARVGSSGDSDFLLTNSDEKPKQLVLSGYVSKDWEFGNTEIKSFLGYAYTDAEDVNPGTSSRAISNFENFSAFDINNARPATSNYSIEHRFTGRLSLAQEWTEGWISRVAFRGQLSSGRPFSYTFGGPRGGDGLPVGENFFGDTDASESRGLVYIPNSAGDPLLNREASDPTAFQEYLEFFSDEEFDGLRGDVAPRNGFNSDWYGKVDMRLSQEIPLPKTLGDDRLRILMDVRNLTNLIDDDWGIYREYGFPYNLPTASARIIDGRYAITEFDVQDQEVDTGVSAWEIQVGARYDF